jgi:hypothetical protein
MSWSASNRICASSSRPAKSPDGPLYSLSLENLSSSYAVTPGFCCLPPPADCFGWLFPRHLVSLDGLVMAIEQLRTGSKSYESIPLTSGFAFLRPFGSLLPILSMVVTVI